MSYSVAISQRQARRRDGTAMGDVSGGTVALGTLDGFNAAPGYTAQRQLRLGAYGDDSTATDAATLLPLQPLATLTGVSNAIVAHYTASATKALAAVQAKRAGLFGSVFGPSDATYGALQASINSANTELTFLQNKVSLGTASTADLAAAVAADEKDLHDLVGYTEDSSLEDVIAKTATATGEDVSGTLNKLAGLGLGTAGRFVWSAIPWWVWAGGAGVIAWKFGLLDGVIAKARNVRPVHGRRRRRGGRRTVYAGYGGRGGGLGGWTGAAIAAGGLYIIWRVLHSGDAAMQAQQAALIQQDAVQDAT